MQKTEYNRVYTGEFNTRIAYPLGGIGSGMFCLEGTGGFSHFSLHHKPDVNNEPIVFAAVCVKGKEGNVARVLEGAVPGWKVLGRSRPGKDGASNGHPGRHYGLPRFANSSFSARFPFGTVELSDSRLPITATLCGWSPFASLQTNDSSLPVAALEYTLANMSDEPVELVFSFHTAHFMSANADTHQVSPVEGGFILHQPAVQDKLWEEGSFCVRTDEANVSVNHMWFRSENFDPLTMTWNTITAGEALEQPPAAEGKPSPGASLFVPMRLQPRESRTVKLQLSWFVPRTNLVVGKGMQELNESAADYEESAYYKPWYAMKYNDIHAVADYWIREYERLREASKMFSDTIYDTTMPPEAIEAITANLSILKSPTVLRQADGRMWAWEGCQDTAGSCHGTCTHVWGYALALAHLFPELEIGLREVELNEGLDERGHQNFRVSLPIAPTKHNYHAASDGQLGGVMNVYREWRISGDTKWMRGLWPQLKLSLAYCMDSWDPERKGVLAEPHHNTYDIQLWGPDGMCSSMYLGALKAASLMAQAAGDSAEEYDELYSKGRAYLETELFNGEYFEQKIVWEGLRTPSPVSGDHGSNAAFSSEAYELMRKEGPQYQYGTGCLSSGVIGAWFAEMCGLGEIVDSDMVRSHLLSVYKYNFKRDLSDHANPQRPGYALGSEGGLLLCTWPKGGKPALPFIYSDEVWTGVEYAVASHLIAIGCIDEGLDIVRACRDRYDGRVRNPFDEYECGHWYARALASYGLIQAWSGIRYDACERTLYISPNAGGDVRSFLCTAEGYGIVGVREGKPFVEVKAGRIQIDNIMLAGRRL